MYDVCIPNAETYLYLDFEVIIIIYYPLENYEIF